MGVGAYILEISSVVSSHISGITAGHLVIRVPELDVEKRRLGFRFERRRARVTLGDKFLYAIPSAPVLHLHNNRPRLLHDDVILAADADHDLAVLDQVVTFLRDWKSPPSRTAEANPRPSFLCLRFREF